MYTKTDKIVLSDVFNDRSAHVHLSVDQQRHWADPQYAGSYDGSKATMQTAQRNAGFIKRLKKMGIETAYIYMSDGHGAPEQQCGGFYKITPSREAGDWLVPKTKKSGFDGTTLKAELAAAQKKILWVSGFHAGACVFSTVLDAAMSGEYDHIFVLSDGIENPRGAPKSDKERVLARMESYDCVSVLTQHQATSYLQALTPTQP